MQLFDDLMLFKQLWLLILVITCRNQQPPINGAMTCSDSNKFRSRCRFTCNQNYTIRGSDYITCGITGRWSERTPSCESKFLILYFFILS